MTSRCKNAPTGSLLFKSRYPKKRRSCVSSAVAEMDCTAPPCRLAENVHVLFSMKRASSLFSCEDGRFKLYVLSRSSSSLTVENSGMFVSSSRKVTSSASRELSSSISSSERSHCKFAANVACSSRCSQVRGTSCENARRNSILVGESPNLRQTAAAVAMGINVQTRIRPSEHGSQISAGRALLYS